MFAAPTFVTSARRLGARDAVDLFSLTVELSKWFPNQSLRRLIPIRVKMKVAASIITHSALL